MGCVMQVGEQSLNVGRNAVLAAGLPDTIPGTTIDRQCGSSQQAAHFAAQGVMAGAYDVVIAAGVEVMTRVPMGSAIADGKYGFPFGPAVSARYAPEGGLVPQGVSAEMIADKWGITREDMDRFGARSQALAAQATAEGRFEREILPVNDAEGKLMTTDEGIRESPFEKLQQLKPAFRSEEDGGRVTAGNSSQITDGASAMLIMSEEKCRALGLTPRARFVNFGLAGDNPQLMLTAPIPATQKALAKAGLTMGDMDITEINEAFASVVLAWEKELHPDMSKVNPNGGAIALGHPLGASGTRLMTTLLHELERTGGRYGLQTMCEGGGMANATIIERLG
jgi:acetyl-CoA acetyltransferase family protein